MSHHPPGSAFHYECESRKIKMFGTMIAGKPKFTGIAVRAPLEGDRQLVLEEFGETYVERVGSLDRIRHPLWDPLGYFVWDIWHTCDILGVFG